MEDDYLLKSYSLCQRHVDYLNSVNPGSHSQAVRSCIDRLISIDRERGRRERLDRLRDNILIIGIGMIFLLFGVVSSNILTIILALGIGVFFSVYGFVTIRVKRT